MIQDELLLLEEELDSDEELLFFEEWLLRCFQEAKWVFYTSLKLNI